LKLLDKQVRVQVDEPTEASRKVGIEIESILS